MKSRIVITIIVAHDDGTAADIENRMEKMLDGGMIQDAIISDMEDIDEDIESVSAMVSVEEVTDVEKCDECSGTRFPEEKHEDHCSLNPKNSV